VLRRSVTAGAIAVVVTTAILSGSGVGSSAVRVRGARSIPAGLAAAIHARFGAGAIQLSRAAARDTEGPLFGFSVAVSADGTTAIVGAPAVNREAGAAYVFHASDAGSWSSSDTPTATLTPASGPKEVFGYNVALSGDGTTAFVGAPAAGGSNDSPGAIHVFHVSAEDAWTSSSTPAATLTAAGSLNLGYAPFAVSSDGTTLIAGAPYYNDSAGGAYVFHVSSEAAWVSSSTPTAVLTVPSESGSDIYVGGSVAISGDGATALLGDAGNPDVGGPGGGAYVYHVSAEDAWTSSAPPLGRLSDDNSGLEYLGAELALSSDGSVALLTGFGAADVFHTAGAASWASASTPTATLTGPYGDFVGGLVALSSDGTNALVTGNAGERAASFIFRVADEGGWASTSTPTAILTNSAEPRSRFGGEFGVLSGDGETALTGNPFLKADTGAADVFHVSDASSWVTSSTPTAVLTDASLARCVVAKLKGLTVSAARSRLVALDCRLGKVRRVHSKAKKGRVVSQSRRSGSRLPVGTKVAVKVAK
jgi:hypothetical protein